jgi:hypothetical protein
MQQRHCSAIVVSNNHRYDIILTTNTAKETEATDADNTDSADAIERDEETLRMVS